ncbi:hypothetical protein BGX28_003292 [Mortierella sp. GBA30]|nr:hypothetical protein BGX28_003292 [Mortierella sp. GBA30]
MSYYNSSSPPVAPRATKPVYSNTSNSGNNFVANTPNYISSPFDDDPTPQNNHGYEKDQYSNPYNPDYMAASYKPNDTQQRSNSYNQSSLHSTQEHSLSPSITEKNLAGGAASPGSQAYAMQHLPNNNHNNNSYDNHNNAPYNRDSYYQNENPHYYNGYDEDRPSLSNDTAPMRPYADMETSEGLTRGKSGVTRVKYGKEKSKYLPCFPCIRSTCGRVTCCFCLLLLLIIIVLAIVVVTVFKLPTVNYLGTENAPQFTYNQGNSTFAINFVANINVTNPNPLGFNFDSITATAYYPNYAPSIGGGTLHNVDFPSKTTKTIHFPISASYSSSQDTGFTVVQDIFNRCGVTGGTKGQLTINYDLKLTIKIIGISISPTIKNQHSNFACPDDILKNLPSIPGFTA